ncbi:MAG: SpoIIE family protein phosphatase [Melioribacteraceae bacterium]|nr:SpoIIE family protein phosphatase [Melioribacteraceae bacterium]
MNSVQDEYKILLVEDDENIAKLFKYNLSKNGYKVEHRINGQQGFECVKTFRPDLIISDIMMPEVDGFEFRKMLLEDSELKAIPFIFLTAKGSEEDILRGYDMEIQEYIIKTASPKVVLAKVSAIIKSSEKERLKAQSEVQKAADSMSAKVVPDEAPSFDEFIIKHWHVPFQNVPGGDFIDYVRIDENKIAIVLGDVMGKKWGAWYFAVAYAGYVRSAIRFAIMSGNNLSASELMSKVNESVYNDERISEVFVTLSIVVIDNKENTATYCGAGDLPLIFNNFNTVETYKSQGLLLGFNTDGGYKDIRLELKSGDEILLITDGIIESRNPNGKQLEIDGLKRIIRQNSGEDTIKIVKEKFTEFTNGRFEDDVSLIYIKKN